MRLMLDDFGTGYSSLNHVKRFRSTRSRSTASSVAGVGRGRGRPPHPARDRLDGERDGRRRHRRGRRDAPSRLAGCATSASSSCRATRSGARRPPPTIEALLRDGLPLDRLALAFEPIDRAPAAAPADARGLPAPAPRRGGATVTLGEAAVACGVSASTVRRWADTGRIAVVRTSGGHRRFPVAELRRLNGEAARAPPTVRAVALPAERCPRCTSCSRRRRRAHRGRHARPL